MVCVPKKQLLGETNGNEEPWKSGGEEQAINKPYKTSKILPGLTSLLAIPSIKAFRLGLDLPEGRFGLQINKI